MSLTTMNAIGVTDVKRITGDTTVIEKDVLARTLKLLRRQIEPHGLVLKHNDMRTSATPDFSVILGQLTSWWEAKLARPYMKIDGKGLQHINMRRIADNTFARYLVFSEVGATKMTSIVHPAHVYESGRFFPEVEVDGWDYLFVVSYIRRTHSAGDKGMRP